MSLTLVLNVDWTPTDGDLSVPAKDIVLTADEQAGKLIGLSTGPGVVARGDVTLALYKEPMLKAPKTATVRLNWVGEVPGGAQKVKLKIGDKEATADLPAAATKIDPAESIEFVLGKAQTAKTYANTNATAGELLKIPLTLKPKKATRKDDAGKEWFSFSTSSINVKVGDKVYPVIGYHIGENVVKPGSYSVGIPYTPNMSAAPMEAIFDVPAGTKSAELLWYGIPVGDVKVGG